MTEGDIDTGGLSTLSDALNVIRKKHPHPDTRREYQARDAEQHGAAPPTTWGAPGVEPRTVLHKVADRQEQEFQQTLARGQAEAAVFGEQKNPAHIQLTPDQQILADRLKVIQHPRAAEFMRRLNEGLPVSVAMV